MITSADNVTPENLASEMDQINARLNLTETHQALHFPKYFQIRKSNNISYLALFLQYLVEDFRQRNLKNQMQRSF